MNRNIVVVGLAIIFAAGLLGTLIAEQFGAVSSVTLRLVADVVGLVLVWKGLG